MSLLICWGAATLAVAGSIFLYLILRSATGDLNDKNNQLSTLQSGLTQYGDTESKTIAFKQIVQTLDSALKNAYPANVFLPKVFAQIDKNVSVTNLSMTDAGVISINATTTSYKAAAQQVLTLQSWQVNGKAVLKNVDMTSVAENIQTDNSVQVPFTITAAIDKTVSLTPVVAATTPTTSDTGGTNAGIQ